MFRNPAFLKSLLINFIKEDWCYELDLDDFKMENVELKTILGEDSNVDMIYRVHSMDRSFHLILLTEFQSSPVPMILRIRDYETKIWQQEIELGKEPNLIIPIVIYNGERNWTESPLIKDFIKVPIRSLERFLHGDYLLFKFSDYEMPDLMAMSDPLAGIMAIDKSSFVENSNLANVEVISNLLGHLKKNNPKNFKIYQDYIRGLFLHKGVESDIIDVIDNPSREVAQVGLAQRIDEAFERAEERGIERGIEQATLANAKAMKSEGLDFSLIAKITGLTIEQINEL